jgi:hypothetical protein
MAVRETSTTDLEFSAKTSILRHHRQNLLNSANHYNLNLNRNPTLVPPLKSTPKSTLEPVLNP